MGKASSAKKIARAARAGASTGPSERREVGYPALVAIVIILGLGLVVFARTTRDAQASPTLQDHWHSAYGVYDCSSGQFLAQFESQLDPQGIHSHQDSLIHIHPFTAGVTGREARLNVFLDAMGASLDDEVLTLPGGQTLEAGVDCDGEPAVLQVVRWSDAIAGGEPDEVILENLDETRFLTDGEAFVIALAPVGADIPEPPSIASLAAVLGQSRDEGIEPPNTTDLPGPQDFDLGTDSSDEDAEG